LLASDVIAEQRGERREIDSRRALRDGEIKLVSHKIRIPLLSAELRAVQKHVPKILRRCIFDKIGRGRRGRH
jgi:hypothetical protein